MTSYTCVTCIFTANEIAMMWFLTCSSVGSELMNPEVKMPFGSTWFSFLLSTGKFSDRKNRKFKKRVVDLAMAQEDFL